MSDVLELATCTAAINEDECYDDYRYDSNEYGSQECDEDIVTDRPSRFVTRHILKRLCDSIERVRSGNAAAKIGAQLECPICKHSFTKKSYQQKFCSDRCKVYYHNKRQVWH